MWHKGDLVKESERLLGLDPILRKIACPDRPGEWACYSLNDWKQMTEAEWYQITTGTQPERLRSALAVVRRIRPLDLFSDRAILACSLGRAHPKRCSTISSACWA
jgi:hypothetical protein